MARIIVIGAGIAGMPAAYDLKKLLGKDHSVTLIGSSEHFQFTPSNPWVTVGWRRPAQILVPIGPNVERKGIEFLPVPVQTLSPQQNQLTLADRRVLDYDYLVIATGPSWLSTRFPGWVLRATATASAPRPTPRRPVWPIRPFWSSRGRW
jgi:sulfide:quinone oxidoreductase